MTWTAQSMCVGWAASPTSQESCQQPYRCSLQTDSSPSSQARINPASSTPFPSPPPAATLTAGIRITLVSGGGPPPPLVRLQPSAPRRGGGWAAFQLCGHCHVEPGTLHKLGPEPEGAGNKLLVVMW